MNFWNYLALAAAIVAAVLAVAALLRIARVTLGLAHWNYSSGAFRNYALVAIFAPLAVWLFTVSVVIG